MNILNVLRRSKMKGWRLTPGMMSGTVSQEVDYENWDSAGSAHRRIGDRSRCDRRNFQDRGSGGPRRTAKARGGATREESPGKSGHLQWIPGGSFTRREKNNSFEFAAATRSQK